MFDCHRTTAVTMPRPKHFAGLVLLAICLLAGNVHGQTTSTRKIMQSSKSAGFLSDALPLKITTTTPSNLIDEDAGEIELEGKQALTVVFSRSVIALGEDFGSKKLPIDKVPFTLDPPVDGRFRWVTTYIARFDPLEDWAPDNSIELKWNPKLKTHDGISLKFSGPSSVTLVTPSLTMEAVDVTSEEADELTDMRWNANVGLRFDKLPEVPPDGKIQLQFSYPVSFSILQEELKLFDAFDGLESSIGIEIEPCEPNVSPVPCIVCAKDEETSSAKQGSCAMVSFDEALENDVRYSLSLDEGVRYNENSGPLLSKVETTFGGLRRFKLPFFETRGAVVSRRALNMWVPHGLPEDAPLSRLSGILRLNNLDTGRTVPYDVERVDSSTLRLTADVEPGTEYRVNVLGSSLIADNYGLPLERSAGQFETADVFPEFLPLAVSNFPSVAIFESGEDWAQKVVALSKGDVFADKEQNCGESAPKVDIWGVSSKSDILGSLNVLLARNPRVSLSGVFGKPDASMSPTEDDYQGEAIDTDIAKLLSKGTGVVAQEVCNFGTYGFQLTIETDLQVVMVVAESERGSSKTGTAWVTSMSTGKPVSGVTVGVYKPGSSKGSGLVEGGDFAKVGEGKTDSTGRASVSLGTEASRLGAVVEHKGKVLYIPRLNTVETSSDDLASSIVLDRKLARPGDTLHVKGYIMQEDGVDVSPAAVGNARVVVTPSLNRTTEALASVSPGRVSNRDLFKVVVSKKYGTFEKKITIPKDARLREYSVQFEGVGGKGSPILGASEGFTVADPRPPTVGLTVDAPFWAKPTGEVEVKVQAESFIGSAVGDAEMTVTWTVNDPKEVSDEPASGELKITTDDSGEATAEIDLGDLPVAPSPGSTLDVDIQWVGPTRELIEESASIRLETANLDVTISRTVNTDLPDQDFGVKVDVMDLRGNPVKTVDVPIILKKVPEAEEKDKFKLAATAIGPAKWFDLDDCKVKSGSNDYDCRLAIPGIGLFALEACVEIGDESLCKREFIGKTSEEWKFEPLKKFAEVGLVELTEGPYDVGDTVKYAIENPFENAYALVMWGSKLGMEHKVFALDDGAFSDFSVKLGKECEANCGVSVSVSVPRQKAFSVGSVPVTSLFDPKAPHINTLTTKIVVDQSNTLDVAVAFPKLGSDPALAPGSTTPVEVKVGADSAEVTVVAVDKSVLEAIPHDLKDIAADFLVDKAVQFSHSGTSDFLVAPEAIDVLVDAFERRKQLDPWVSLINHMNPSFMTAELHLTEEEWLEQYSEYITLSTPRPFDPLRGPLAAVESDDFALRSLGAVADVPLLSTFVETADSSSPVTVRVQKKFVATPTFETDVAQNGKATVDFKAPDNVGTFVVRAYATTGKGKFGSGESELIVRRKVSLTSSAPRFARVGDEFEAGAVVTVAGGSKSPVSVSVLVSGGGLEIVGPKLAKVTLGDDGQEEIRFKFLARKIGKSSITISADAGSGVRDALKVEIPVEGLQDAVILGSSFPAGEKIGEDWQEGIKLPDAVPGSGFLKIQAGVGRLPTVMALVQGLLDENLEHSCPIDADYALALSAIPLITETYGVQELDGNLNQAPIIELIQGFDTNFTAAFQTLALGNLTSTQQGLGSSLECPEDRSKNERKDISIAQNAKGVWVFRTLEGDFKGTDVEVVANNTAAYKSLASIWEDALVKGLLAEAKEARTKKNPIDLFTVARARAALGGDWAVPKGVPSNIAQDLSMTRLSKGFNSMSIEGQAYYVLARLEMSGGKSHPDIKKARESWITLLRIGGRSAYVSAAKGSSAPASNTANALVLLALTKAGVTSTLLDKLATYVGNPPTGQYGFNVFSSFDKTAALVAMREYDIVKDNDNPNIRLSVRSGSVSVLPEFVFNDAKRPIATGIVKWEDLQSPPKPLEFWAQGIGEVTIAVSMSFVPAKLLPFPTFRGIFVQRSIQLDSEDGADNAASLAVVPVGSVVTVNIQLTVPDRLGPSTVRALLPAGLEPVDPNVDGSGNFCPIPVFRFFASSFFAPCPVQETKPSVVTFTFNSLTEGTQTVNFRAIAATAGEFALPPVRAFVDDQPEVMGLSPAGKLTICSSKSCKPVAEKTGPSAKPCPKDCNNAGGCDLATGKCICLDGFSKDDCSVFKVQ